MSNDLIDMGGHPDIYAMVSTMLRSSAPMHVLFYSTGGGSTVFSGGKSVQR
jgi:hypothetical protein